MDDLISRQAVKELAHNQMREKYCGMALKKQRDFYIKLADSIIDLLPSIQPKRGKWIRTGSGSLYDHYECSECGKAPKWECMGDNRWKIAFTDFCPNCGSDMREVNNETN